MSLADEQRLRIALFTGNYNYVRDGVALTLNRLVAYLEKRGIAVLVLAPTVKKPAFAATGELVSIPSISIPFRREYRAAFQISALARKRLDEFQPTLIMVAAPDGLGRAALKYAALNKLPVVASFHTRFDSYLKFYRLGFLEKLGKVYLQRFYRHCAKVYPPSQSMADTLRQEGIAKNLEVWGRGIDGELFHPKKRSAQWRHLLGIADDDLVVSFVSRLVKEKNTELLVRVLQQLQAKHENLKVLIVGHGPEEAYLRRELPQAIFTGFQSGEDLARAYASSDIFLFPSESETFGNVTLEAMASGLPAVCADATGSNSIVIDGVTGFLQNAKIESGFVDLVSTLVVDRELRQKMAIAARARALEFNWDAINAKLVTSFAGVVSRSTPP